MFNFDRDDVIGKIVIQHASPVGFGDRAKKVGIVSHVEIERIVGKDGIDYPVTVIVVKEIHDQDGDLFFTIQVDHIGLQPSKHHIDVLEFFP